MPNYKSCPICTFVPWRTKFTLGSAHKPSPAFPPVFYWVFSLSKCAVDTIIDQNSQTYQLILRQLYRLGIIERKACEHFAISDISSTVNADPPNIKTEYFRRVRSLKYLVTQHLSTELRGQLR